MSDTPKHRWELAMGRQIRLFLLDAEGREYLAAQIQKVDEGGVYKVMVIRTSDDYDVWDGGYELDEAVSSLARHIGNKSITDLCP